MRSVLVMAGVVAGPLAVLVAFSMHRRIYLRWMSSWVGGEPGIRYRAQPQAERLLTAPMPGRVVGDMESEFSGDGHVALVESGIRLTAGSSSGKWSSSEKTTWGAFWPEVTGYLVLQEIGAVRIEVSGHGYVQVETGRGAVQDNWDSVLGMKGVPLSG